MDLLFADRFLVLQHVRESNVWFETTPCLYFVISKLIHGTRYVKFIYHITLTLHCIAFYLTWVFCCLSLQFTIVLWWLERPTSSPSASSQWVVLLYPNEWMNASLIRTEIWISSFAWNGRYTGCGRAGSCFRSTLSWGSSPWSSRDRGSTACSCSRLVSPSMAVLLEESSGQEQQQQQQHVILVRWGTRHFI